MKSKSSSIVPLALSIVSLITSSTFAGSAWYFSILVLAQKLKLLSESRDQASKSCRVHYAVYRKMLSLFDIRWSSYTLIERLSFYSLIYVHRGKFSVKNQLFHLKLIFKSPRPPPTPTYKNAHIHNNTLVHIHNIMPKGIYRINKY